MSAPEKIQQLVQQFIANRAAYHAGKYNEAQLRQEFLNPFFEALGWDMTNRKGFAPQYREVIHEDAINVQGVLALHQRTPATPHEQDRLSREIAATDDEIDRLVYALYGLTEDEIKIVEGE